jgi:hypothetical protein
MLIPGAAVVAAGAPDPAVVAIVTPPHAGEHGWVARTAAVAAEDIAQIVGGVFKNSAPAARRSMICAQHRLKRP